MDTFNHERWIACVCLIGSLTASLARAGEPYPCILPEQRQLSIRDPLQMRQVAVPTSPQPMTVTSPRAGMPDRKLSLDEAINIALQNSEVVRVLSGVTASTSGRSIYDAAITNTGIDNARLTFDPQLQINNTWGKTENPTAIADPGDATQSIITGNSNDNYAFDFGLSQKNQHGGTAALGVNTNSSRIRPGVTPLSPLNRTATELSYTQPLLLGAGTRVNRRTNRANSAGNRTLLFPIQNSVQGLVQGVIEAYWTLVFAKTDLWAREQQVEQAEFANQRTEELVEVGEGNAGDLAQTQLALENFRASLLASEANVLLRQGALLNILGLPAFEAERTVPVTPMIDEHAAVNWEAINQLAQQQRPDIIELKLILEADQQRLLQASNQTLPQLDGVALYRWNGLEGEVPAGNRIRSGNGEFNDWSLGVNFSVPLGLRRERALLRQQQLIIKRDRANLDQGLHQMQHLLALSVRNLDQFFAQYERFQKVREAARINLDLQLNKYNEGIIQFIVVLQAIVDWGNSVSSEAQALSQYNTELARLELQTGTILETHGIVFFEERFTTIGPLHRVCGSRRCYPASRRPGANSERYETGDKPSEEYFDLQDPVGSTDKSEKETKETEDPLDLDEDVNFESKEGEEQKEPMRDEEIDELLEKPRASRWVPKMLRGRFGFR